MMMNQGNTCTIYNKNNNKIAHTDCDVTRSFTRYVKHCKYCTQNLLIVHTWILSFWQNDKNLAYNFSRKKHNIISTNDNVNRAYCTLWSRSKYNWLILTNDKKRIVEGKQTRIENDIGIWNRHKIVHLSYVNHELQYAYTHEWYARTHARTYTRQSARVIHSRSLSIVNKSHPVFSLM